MPLIEPDNVSENPYSGEPYFTASQGGGLVGVNEEMTYDNPDWEAPELVGQTSGNLPPITILDHSGGYATIRVNRDLYYNASIWFQGQVSGTIAAGSTFRGQDLNGNGIPDLFERLFRKGKIHYEI